MVGISEIIVRPGLINVDFADVRSIMSNAGTALMVKQMNHKPYTSLSDWLLAVVWFILSYYV